MIHDSNKRRVMSRFAKDLLIFWSVIPVFFGIGYAIRLVGGDSAVLVYLEWPGTFIAALGAYTAISVLADVSVSMATGRQFIYVFAPVAVYIWLWVSWMNYINEACAAAGCL